MRTTCKKIQMYNITCLCIWMIILIVPRENLPRSHMWRTACNQKALYFWKNQIKFHIQHTHHSCIITISKQNCTLKSLEKRPLAYKISTRKSFHKCFCWRYFCIMLNRPTIMAQCCSPQYIYHISTWALNDASCFISYI